MSLWTGTDHNNNLPPGKIKISPSPHLWVSPQTSAWFSSCHGGGMFGLPGCN